MTLPGCTADTTRGLDVRHRNMDELETLFDEQTLETFSPSGVGPVKCIQIAMRYVIFEIVTPSKYPLMSLYVATSLGQWVNAPGTHYPKLGSAARRDLL